VNHASGNIYEVKGKRGAVWHMRYRLPDGTESRKRIGKVWKKGGRPPQGYFTRAMAERELRAFLTDADRGVLPAKAQPVGATVADAADAWLAHAENVAAVKPATLHDYQSAVQTHIKPAFGERPVDGVSTREIARWQTRLAERGLSPRTRNKLLTILHGVFQRARKNYGLAENPAAGVERARERYDEAAYDFYSPEEVWALVRAADNEQDAAIFLTAAFTGLRMGELRALRWKDVDFARSVIRVEKAVSGGVIGDPKGRRMRSVGMVPEVALVLDGLSRRGVFIGETDLVFPGIRSAERVGALLDADEWDPAQDEVLVAEPLDRSALRRRFIKARDRAGLKPLRFHDLRHTFASLAVNAARNPVELQEWLGHTDFRTTQRYLHHRDRGDEAQRLAQAFAVEEPAKEPVEDAA
jgi:integrase